MNIATLSKQAVSVAWLVALAHLLIELCHNFLPVVYPLLIKSMGLTYSQIGTLALVGGIFGALMQPLFGYLSDRWNPRLIVALSVAWIGAVMGLVGFIDRYWLLLPVIALGALGSAAFHPAGALLATVGGTRERRGAAMSLFSVGGNLGSAFSPLLVGLGLAWIGLPGTAILVPIAFLAGLFLHLQLRAFPEPPARTVPPRTGADRAVLPQSKGSWPTVPH